MPGRYRLGGDTTVASITLEDSDASRSGAPPAARIVTAWRGMFHSFKARATAMIGRTRRNLECRFSYR